MLISALACHALIATERLILWSCLSAAALTERTMKVAGRVPALHASIGRIRVDMALGSLHVLDASDAIVSTLGFTQICS